MTFVIATGDITIDQNAVERKEVEARLHAQVWSSDSVLRSRDLYRDASLHWSEAGYDAHSSRCLREVARLEIIMANLDEAQKVIERARRLDSRIRNSAGLAEDFSLLSMVFLKRGDREQARAYDAIAQVHASHSGDLKASARASFSSAAISYSARDFSAMKRKLEKALDLFSQSGDAIGQIECLIELAYVQIIENNRPGGKEFAQTAIDLATKTGHNRGRVLGMIVLGDAHERMGEWAKAASIFREAESLYPDKLDQYERGILFNRLAHYYLSHHEPEMARKYFQKSFECYDLTNDDEGRSEVLTDLGDLYFQQGDKGAALSSFQEAKEIAERTKDPLSLAVISLKFGDLHLKNNELSKAETAFRTSFSNFTKLGVEYRLAEIENKMGMILEERHDYFRARNLYVKALDRNVRILSRLGQAESLFRLARVESIIGNVDSSLDFIHKSTELTDLSLNETANDRLETSLRDSIDTRYQLYTNLLMRAAKTAATSAYSGRALQVAESSRTRVMLQNLSLSEAEDIADADPETVRTEKDIRITLNAKSDKLTELIGASGTSEEIKNLESEVGELENQLEEIRAELKQKSPIYSAIKNPEPFDVADFQREVLDEDSLLLEFSLGKEESYLWAVDKRDVTAYFLPPREQIEARVDKLRGLLGSRQLKQGESLEDYQKRIALAETEYKSEARALSNDLLGQAKEKLAGKKLIVVADGRLHYFPLGSLPMPGTEDAAPILLTNEVVYAPSASTLKILRMKKNNETRPQKDLLVFADPVFSKSDERIVGLDTGGSGFVSMILPMFRSIESLESMPRLPASEAEAKSISEVVGANQTTVRAGFAASRDGVLNGGIEDYKILHFATHGLIDEKRPELSGILLSLYNDEGKQNDGGFIRLQDVYGLRLNSDLVVLSACDTGIGKEIKGEGVMSLNNAFLQAGAKSVVSSLWKVDDSATKDLMTEFYRGMAEDDLTAAAALRGAQIKMYNDPRYHSPFYWAAFTASGDTSVKVAFTSYAWLYALIATAAIATVILALVGVRRLSRRKLGE